MNNVSLVGRLTRDVEIRTTGGGDSVCNFTVAVQRDYKNAQGEYEADFIGCVAWRKTAEFIQKYFIKGQQIGIVGRLQTRTYETDGQKRYVTEVVANNVEFVGKAATAGQKENTTTVGADAAALPLPDDGELPF